MDGWDGMGQDGMEASSCDSLPQRVAGQQRLLLRLLLRCCQPGSKCMRRSVVTVSHIAVLKSEIRAAWSEDIVGGSQSGVRL